MLERTLSNGPCGHLVTSNVTDPFFISGLLPHSRHRTPPISVNIEPFSSLMKTDSIANPLWIVFLIVALVAWALFLIFLIVILSIAPESLTLFV